jgi:hypothetical protein
MLYCRFLGVLAGSLLVLLGGAPSAVAQWENIETVEGAYGEQITLLKQPHSVADGLSARALGIAATDTTTWALSLIGAAPDDAISVAYGDEQLPVLDVQRPSDGIGPTKVFVSESSFLTMAESETVTLTVGSTRAPLPEPLRREMKEIFRRVN